LTFGGNIWHHPTSPTKGNTFKMFLPVEYEFERERRAAGDVYQRPEQGVFADMRRAQQTFLDTLEQRWWSEIIRRTGLPVGTTIDRRDISGTSGGLSRMVIPPRGIKGAEIPQTVVRRAPPPTRTVVPQRISDPIRTGQDTEEAMDLGAIMGGLGQAVDIYGQIQDIRRGPVGIRQPTVVQPQFVSSAMPTVGMGAMQPAFSPLALAAPAVGSLGGKIGTAIAGLGLGLAADEIAVIAGAASKVKCRRRRRRLATHSDIKDLAALKAVLGSGKAFDTWIATRKM